MHNTILMTFMLTLTSVSASAQFYTITRETDISGTERLQKVEITETKGDTIEVADSIISPGLKIENTENLGQTVLNARKSDDYKSSRILPIRGAVSQAHRDTIRQQTTAPEATESLPELTIPNVLAEIKKNNIRYPKIVLAQAILETGWFKSSVCRNKHNLFGLTNPRTGKYYEFNHWTESVKAYYTKVQYRYKGGNYLLWLDKIGYAEEKTYVRALIQVLKQLK